MAPRTNVVIADVPAVGVLIVGVLVVVGAASRFWKGRFRLAPVNAYRLHANGGIAQWHRFALQSAGNSRNVNPMEGSMAHLLQRREVVLGLAGVALAHTMLGRAGAALAADKIKPGPSSALIVVDVQNCFLPGGSLAVKDGDQVIPVINRIAKDFDNVVMTQDWHTPHHVSFASTHDGKKPFEVIKLAYGNQVLWPDHCVQGTEGASIAKDINIPQAALIIRKGFHNDVDSYSAFLEADKETRTGLASYLKERKIDTVFVTGLATDFCVAWTAIDARNAGLNVYVVDDACRGIDINGSIAKAWEDMTKAGVKKIQSTDIG
jgi:nicotinamidase/pyrazinamidase